MRVILDEAEGRRVFDRPQRLIRADRADEVPGALAELVAAPGQYRAGWFAYELGYALEPRLAPLMPPVDGPLLCFGVYDAPSAAPPVIGRAYAGPLKPEWDAAAYAARFDRIKDYIAAGDIYQANLSLRAHFAFAGDPLALYERLKAAGGAPHCAYVDYGVRQILSLSPELFFDLTVAGMLTARPMKGTMPRDAGAAALAASEKDRAENLMIVDLIRNDLGRIAETGSVTVPELFRIESYPTLNTMVSTVTAQLKSGAGVGDIVRALFPCGSVTGAPKIRAMEILRDMESGPRGAYCGAIGCFAPDGSARFNVAIRTLTISQGRGVVGLGGGVVQDSHSDSEYAECLLKGRFLEAERRPLELIETLRFDGAFTRLESHLARMAASAPLFGLAFDAAEARRVLDAAVAGTSGAQRARLTLDEAGRHAATTAPLPPNPSHWGYRLSPHVMQSTDLLLRHKTSWREVYETAIDTDEVIFRNEHGELTEGARSNIFVRRGGTLVTPSLSSGLLDGRLRAELIGRGECREAVLTEADLDGEVLFGNSLRGLVPGQRV